MAKETNIEAVIRDGSGKSAVKKVMAGGKIPSILYGLNEKPVNIAIDKIFIQKELNAGGFLTKIFNLNIDGKKNLAIPRDIQFHPLSDQPIHVDFLRLSEDSKITLDIPTRFINEEASPGLKRGGVLNVNRRTVQLNCPANNIPEELVFDLTDLEIGDTIRISMVNLDEGVQPTITDRDFTVASVAAPTVVKEPEPQAEGAEGEGDAATDGDADTKATEAAQESKEEDKS
ncbi:MAG: 50S ribosomal protein L25/general stress protein Ctc [Pelagibacterales bacterium]|nr:50S ribosomal protein L25/general stress protein Ctc [Pelagibacterales bacterium]